MKQIISTVAIATVLYVQLIAACHCTDDIACMCCKKVIWNNPNEPHSDGDDARCGCKSVVTSSDCSSTQSSQPSPCDNCPDCVAADPLYASFKVSLDWEPTLLASVLWLSPQLFECKANALPSGRLLLANCIKTPPLLSTSAQLRI